MWSREQAGRLAIVYRESSCCANWFSATGSQWCIGRADVKGISGRPAFPAALKDLPLSSSERRVGRRAVVQCDWLHSTLTWLLFHDDNGQYNPPPPINGSLLASSSALSWTLHLLLLLRDDDDDDYTDNVFLCYLHSPATVNNVGPALRWPLNFFRKLSCLVRLY